MVSFPRAVLVVAASPVATTSAHAAAAQRNLDRSQCSWKRLAARHFEGGHLLFADGHAEWALNRDVTTNAQGSRDPLTPDGDWNTERFIFEPQGPARN